MRQGSGARVLGLACSLAGLALGVARSTAGTGFAPGWRLVSLPRLVTLTDPLRLAEGDTKASLYYVPGVHRLVQARTLLLGAASALSAALALAVAWRARGTRAR